MSSLLKNLWKKVVFPPKEARGPDPRRVPECFGTWAEHREACRRCRVCEECRKRR